MGGGAGVGSRPRLTRHIMVIRSDPPASSTCMAVTKNSPRMMDDVLSAIGPLHSAPGVGLRKNVVKLSYARGYLRRVSAPPAERHSMLQGTRWCYGPCVMLSSPVRVLAGLVA